MSKPSTAPKVEVVRNKEGEGGSSSVWCVTGVVHTEEFNNDEESQGVVEKPFVLNAVAVIHEMAVSAFYAKVIAISSSRFSAPRSL